jgi:hypothetical protein
MKQFGHTHKRQARRGTSLRIESHMDTKGTPVTQRLNATLTIPMPIPSVGARSQVTSFYIMLNQLQARLSDTFGLRQRGMGSNPYVRKRVWVGNTMDTQAKYCASSSIIVNAMINMSCSYSIDPVYPPCESKNNMQTMQ